VIHDVPDAGQDEARRWRPRRWLSVMALVGVFVAVTGCLGPTQVDRTGTAPFGNLDAISADGPGIRVSGWVADPDTSAPIIVKVGSEGRVYDVVADQFRPDVGAAYPRVGSSHGFNFWFPDLPPGRHGICIWAENVGRGNQTRLLGCKNLDVGGGSNPIGSVDVVSSPAPQTLRVAGWALDQDTTDPIEIGVSVDGAFVTRRIADVSRPDVAAAFGRGASHGYGLDFPATPGNRLVCIVAFNRGWGEDRLIGCGRADVLPPPTDNRPNGLVNKVQPLTGGLRVAGTASDPDGPVTGARIEVRGGATTVVPVTNGAFTTDLGGLAAGPVRVCVTLLDAPSPPGANVITGDRPLPCSTAVVVAVGAGAGSVSVGTGGSPASSSPVGPAAGAPLANIDRDAGVSVTLRDGSLLWLFGDSSEVNVNGQIQYFVNNTAAWAAPGSLTTTRDPATAVQFAGVAGATWNCPADKPNKARWPLSAVKRSVGAVDRVTVFMGNVCLGGALQIESRGVSVVEWDYNPASPPNGQAITGSVVSDRLFTESEPAFGTAAVDGGNGFVYAYACDRPPGGSGLPNQYGPCRAARVPAANVTTRSSWSYWNGSTWVLDNPAAATAMTMPVGVDGVTEAPVSSMTINRDPNYSDVYVMAYSPWPGFTDRIYVRVATSPQGPWTAPVEVLLPGCNQNVGGNTYYCYAGTSQPALSEPGLLGLGYYDQLVAVGPTRGQYLTIKVPFSVVIN